MSSIRPAARRLAAASLAHRAPALRRSPLVLAVPRPAPLVSTRAFSACLRAAERHDPSAKAAKDPRWTSGEKVTYDELKPITRMPSDVSWLAAWFLSVRGLDAGTRRAD